MKCANFMDFITFLAYTCGVETEEKKGQGGTFKLLPVALEIGYTIAIPIVLLALLGRFLDTRLDSSPWLLLTGILLSILVSSFLIYQKVKKFLQ